MFTARNANQTFATEKFAFTGICANGFPSIKTDLSQEFRDHIKD
jgi:hypothetical protein